jgi:hypothetical protein
MRMALERKKAPGNTMFVGSEGCALQVCDEKDLDAGGEEESRTVHPASEKMVEVTVNLLACDQVHSRLCRGAIVGYQ